MNWLAALAVPFLLQPGPRPIDTLARDIRAAKVEAGRSEERYIWRIYHLTEKALNGAEWKPMLASLKRQGAEISQPLDQDSADVTLSGTEFRTGSGLLHKLRIRMLSRAETSKTKPTRFVVGYVLAELIAKPKVSIDDLAASGAYAEDSVLARLLKRPGVQKLANDKPQVAEISLSYRPSQTSRWDDPPPGAHWPYLFEADITLEDPEGNGVRLDYEASSGLDPDYDINRKPLSNGFVQSDKAGELHRPHGWEEDKVVASYEPGTEPDYLILRQDRPPYKYDRPTVALSAGDLRTLPATTTRLSLGGSDLSDRDYKLLGRFRSLQELSFELMPLPDATSAEGLSVLKNLAKLKSLTVRFDVLDLTPRVARIVGSLPALEELTLGLQTIKPGLLRTMLSAPKLRSVDVNYYPGLKESELRPLWKRSNLTRLGFFQSGPVGPSSLAGIARQRGLRELELSNLGPESEPALIKIVKTCPLTSLSLSACTVSPTLLQAIAQSKTLKDLNIAWSTGPTDQSIQTLKSLTNPNSIRFMNCTGVTKTGIKKLMASLQGKYELQ